MHKILFPTNISLLCVFLHGTPVHTAKIVFSLTLPQGPSLHHHVPEYMQHEALPYKVLQSLTIRIIKLKVRHMTQFTHLGYPNPKLTQYNPVSHSSQTALGCLVSRHAAANKVQQDVLIMLQKSSFVKLMQTSIDHLYATTYVCVC